MRTDGVRKWYQSFQSNRKSELSFGKLHFAVLNGRYRCLQYVQHCAYITAPTYWES
jgi:hypothetical protein